jgi:hypothetical protein
MIDEEENAPRFPYDAKTQSEKDEEEFIVKSKSTKPDLNTANTKWNTLRKLISSTPTNAKSFLGVDDGKTLNHWNQRKFRVISRNMVFGGRIKENSIQQCIDDIAEQTQIEQTDPFLMCLCFFLGSDSKLKKKFKLLNLSRRYSLIGNQMKIKPNTSVANIALDQVKGVLNRVGFVELQAEPHGQ